MASIFTKIVNGEIPCYKIAEDERFLAFLDINPLKKGHTLIISKKETDYFFDIENEDLSDMIIFAKEVAVAIKAANNCKRVGVAVLGMDVPHAHIHLVPLDSANDLNFSNPKLKLTTQEFKVIQQAIVKQL